MAIETVETEIAAIVTGIEIGTGIETGIEIVAIEIVETEIVAIETVEIGIEVPEVYRVRYPCNQLLYVSIYIPLSDSFMGPVNGNVKELFLIII